MRDTENAPTYHGQDLRAAVLAARARDGICIRSLAPGAAMGDPNAEYGYWADDRDAFCRVWEQLINLSYFDAQGNLKEKRK